VVASFMGWFLGGYESKYRNGDSMSIPEFD
jgi:hypothetical protein